MVSHLIRVKAQICVTCKESGPLVPSLASSLLAPLILSTPVTLASLLFLRYSGPLYWLFPQPEMPFPQMPTRLAPQFCQVLTKKITFLVRPSQTTVSRILV